MKFNNRVLQISVLAFCLWQSSDLLMTWKNNASEQLGAVAFVAWLLPAFLAALIGDRNSKPRYFVLASSLVISTIGTLMWVNFLQHFAVIMVIVAVTPQIRGRWIWFLSAVLWLPLFGWLCNAMSGQSVMLWRLVGSTALSLAVIALNQRRIRTRYSVEPLSRGTVVTSGFVLLLCVNSTCLHAETFTYSPVQSSARPMGLDIVDLVGLAGSDAASTDFLENRLPGMQDLIDLSLGEKSSVKGTRPEGLIALDPEKLELAVPSDVRAYFVGEGAGYHNTFGFNTDGGGIDSGDPLLIFPDASSPNSYLSSGGGNRTVSEPLMPGDFVELGSFDAGTGLDFFLIANGARGGTNLYSTDESVNPDGIAHVVTFSEVANPYLLIGFEDLFGGGDEDFNDLLVALYIGEENVATLIETAALDAGVPAPEPASLSLMVLTITAWFHRRKRRLQTMDHPSI